MKSVLVAVIILFPCGAFAACHIKGERAIVCPSGRDAVTAYQAFAYDAAKMGQSYSRAILGQSGCFFIGRQPEIRQLSHGRVPFGDGWAGVTTVVVGSGAGAIADQYLEGKCDPHKAETYVMKPLESAPDFSH